MNRHSPHGLVLAVHPTSKGFGWALFEGPGIPVDWGIATARIDRSATSIKRFRQLLGQYEPKTLVLEKYEGPGVRRSERIKTLAKTMRGYAGSHDMTVFVYSRAEVGTAVAGAADATRHAIAQNISERIPLFKPRLPGRRRVWESERDQQCLFDAIALGLVHYALTRPRP